MNILLLTAYFPPDVGSASHLFYELGQALVKDGHGVVAVTTMPGYHPSGDLKRYRWRMSFKEEMGGVQVYRFAVPHLARNTPIGRGVWQFTCAGRLAAGGLKIARPDVTLVYSPPLTLGLSAAVLRSLRGSRFVLNVQDLFPQQAIDLGQMRSKLLIRFFEWLERQIYNRADLITVHSDGNRSHVLARGGGKNTTFVMPNHVDTEHIRPGPRANQFRQRLGLDVDFVATFAGVMGFNQDLDVILEAAALLRDHSRIRFLLVGDGVEKQRLVAKTERLGLNSVTWLPMQPRDLYPELLAASDVGLATLKGTVQTPVVPSKILGIMAAGRPVVAAMDLQGDAPKLVAQARAGVAVPPGDPDSLAKALLRLYEDPEHCRQLGQNGRSYAETHLSHVAAAKRYVELFQRVAGQARDQVAPRGQPAAPPLHRQGL